ncbi:MAG: DUF192 domain-containing protein [Patescibacteria group bacterium]
MKLISTQFLLLAIFIVISVSLAAFAPFIEKKLAFKTNELPASTLSNSNSSSDSKLSAQSIKIADAKFNIELANTYDSRTRGLSGRKSLADNTGLLFVFDSSARYGFWMKDMKFPIDIIWIDDAGKVVFIEKNVKPSTFPKVFYPSAPASFVLEINAGLADTHNIKIDSKTCEENFIASANLVACV